MSATTPTVARCAPDGLAGEVARAVEAGARFAALVAFADLDGATTLRALVASRGRIEIIAATLAAGVDTYPALTPLVPAAFWYEREIHDLFGLVPDGHPRLDPLVFPVASGRHDSRRPRPGRPDEPAAVELDMAGLPGHVSGEGVFTIPYGPVRSGVHESVEYVVETFGEDIPHLRVRAYPKHRGVVRRFAGLGVEDGVLLAERVEGTLSVAHATAFCQALEARAGVEPPMGAQLVRVIHLELERVANHLDSVIRHTEAAGQAVAYARMTLHKERVLRLRSRLCGHRFGRGVVVPGGVNAPPDPDGGEFLVDLDRLEGAVVDDARLLMATPSFLDRLRATGILSPQVAVSHGALGPLGRASGLAEDVRTSRPYGAYGRLGFDPAEIREDGDALARQHVRLEEIAASFHLARQALGQLGGQAAGGWRTPFEPPDGLAVGWVEAPQGELLYVLEVEGGRLAQVKARCASFHNLSLFSHAFGGDIFTDFAFIEASFGLSIAGVAG